MPKRKLKKQPSIRVKKAFSNALENGGNISKAMRDAGYSGAMAKNPHKLTQSEAWKVLMDRYLPDELLAKSHRELLNATRVEHMVFPLGPADDDEIPDEEMDETDEELEEQPHGGALLRRLAQKDHTKLTDDDIRYMLAEVNCTVRKIVNSQQARHVYFWSLDNKARKDAIDLAYKLRGSYAPEKKQHTGAFSLSALLDEADNDEPLEQDE